VRLLLDTHAFIWWVEGNSRMSRRARTAIGRADNEIYVSAVSAWEIATKFRLGKWSGIDTVATDVSASIANQGFSGLAISPQHGQLAGSLPLPHKDPFDRMLIAQSILERMPLVSIEGIFDTYGVERLW
jgi:PIN domain nuclease of toxin-antitoxin system